MEFWKNGLLPFNSAKITTNYVAGEDGTEHPDFLHIMLRNQLNIITVTFDIHQGKNKKAKVGQSSAFLCSSTS